MRFLTITLLTLLGNSLFSIDAAACSAKEGYRVPTNLELVQRADVIALVRVVDGPADFSAEDGPDSPAITVAPLRYLKGSEADGRLKLAGVTTWNGRPIQSIVTPLSEAHFSVGLGACIRMFYAKDDLVLAMFEKTEAGLLPIGSPWSRASENVAGPDDLWVRTVEKYLSLSTAEPYSDDRAVALRDELRKQPGIEPQAIAADLDRHLARERKEHVQHSWRSMNGPDEAVLMIRNRATGRGAALYCGGPDRKVAIVGPSMQASELAVQVGGIRYKTARPTSLELPKAFAANAEKVTEAVFLNPTNLVAALHVNEQPVAIEADGAAIAPAALPEDMFMRWAERCEGWLSKRPAR